MLFLEELGYCPIFLFLGGKSMMYFKPILANFLSFFDLKASYLVYFLSRIIVTCLNGLQDVISCLIYRGIDHKRIMQLIIGEFSLFFNI